MTEKKGTKYPTSYITYSADYAADQNVVAEMGVAPAARAARVADREARFDASRAYSKKRKIPLIIIACVMAVMLLVALVSFFEITGFSKPFSLYRKPDASSVKKAYDPVSFLDPISGLIYKVSKKDTSDQPDFYRDGLSTLTAEDKAVVKAALYVLPFAIIALIGTIVYILVKAVLAIIKPARMPFGFLLACVLLGIAFVCVAGIIWSGNSLVGAFSFFNGGMDSRYVMGVGLIIWFFGTLCAWVASAFAYKNVKLVKEKKRGRSKNAAITA